MAAERVVIFKESPRGPWGLSSKPSSRAGREIEGLPDAIPRAQTIPAEVVGSISHVNTYLSQEGLHPRKDSLPPLIFDLYSPPPPPPTTSAVVELDPIMASRSRLNSKTKKRGSKISQHDPKGSIVQSPMGSNLDLDLKTADTQLIELAIYPGYNPHFPTPLPHGMDALEQMRRVTSAQTKLSAKLEGYRKAWKQLFYSPSSQAIFLDYYWWFFLHRYQTNQLLTQDQLFSRISGNYVKMICEPVVEIKWKDSFFKMYPDVISQCVFSTFIYAYPNSWNNFDEHFKTELCQYISLWQVGTKPIPSSWKKWELHLLEPPNLFKYASKEEPEEKIPQARRPSRAFDLDTLVKSAKVKETDSKSSSQTKLSFVDVRKVLSGSSETLIPLVREDRDSEGQGDKIPGDLVPSASEEKKIGIVMEQFKKLEKKSCSPKVKITEDSPSSLSSLTLVSPGDPDGEKKMDVHTSRVLQSGGGGDEKVSKGKGLHPSKIPSVSPKTNKQSCPQHSGSPKSKQITDSGKKVVPGELKKMALSFKDRPKQDESPTLKGPEFEHVVFDLYGHSPLVKHYMIHKNLTHVNEKAIVVGRTEISEEPPRDAVCYRDIITQSKATGKNNQELFQKHYLEQKQSMAAAQKKRKAATQMHEKNVKLLLGNRKEVQKLSNELALHIAQPRVDYDRTAVVGAISKSLRRVKC